MTPPKGLFSTFVLRIWDYKRDEEVPSMTKRALNLPDWPILGRWAGASIALHHFHQGEPGEDTYHSHEFDFWTFPFVSYKESVLDRETGRVSEEIVPRWRITQRQAELTHYVMGRYYPADWGPGVVNQYEPFYTVVVNLRARRDVDIITFGHPEYTYEGMLEDLPQYDPREFWVNTPVTAATGTVGVPVPLYPRLAHPDIQLTTPDIQLEPAET